MYVAVQNLRANHITYEKGKEYDSLPEGYEHCFKKIGRKGDKEVETASLEQGENRAKKNNRRNKRTSKTKSSKKTS